MVPVHQAARAARMSSQQVAFQNASRVHANAATVRRLIEAAAVVPVEDLRELADEIRDVQDLQPEEIEARLGASPRFAWLAPMLPRDRMETYVFISMVVGVIGLIVAIAALAVALDANPTPTRPAPQPAVVQQVLTPEQVEHIIGKVVEHIEQVRTTEPTAEPSPSTEPQPKQPNTPKSP